MITTGSVDWPCIRGSSRLSTENDSKEFECKYCSVLKSGLRSPAMEMDGIEGRSVNKTLEMRLFPPVVTTKKVTPHSLFT